jgi:hypothetical protein
METRSTPANDAGCLQLDGDASGMAVDYAARKLRLQQKKGVFQLKGLDNPHQGRTPNPYSHAFFVRRIFMSVC